MTLGTDLRLPLRLPERAEGEETTSLIEEAKLLLLGPAAVGEARGSKRPEEGRVAAAVLLPRRRAAIA